MFRKCSRFVFVLIALATFQVGAKTSGQDGSKGVAIADDSPSDWLPADVARIDSLISAFMESNEVPGLAIAIAKDGRLVLSKGYGKATHDGMPVTSESLFRIASVSKPITAVAIMKLVEQGRLKLSDRVFGEGAILGTRFGQRPYDIHETAVTVDHLLHHLAGDTQWNNKGDDGSSSPMFQKIELNHGDLIGDILDSREITTPPGTTYAYSNFGYCVLGRVIEAKTDQGYEAFVKNAILRPCGITAMRVAGNTLDDRHPNEVEYFGDRPYSMNVNRMDAHGGWIASAEDLVRFAVHVDGFRSTPDILSKDSIDLLTRPSVPNKNYAKGWAVNASGNWLHSGKIDGTGAILVRTHEAFCWALLMNKAYVRDVDALMWRVKNAVSQWPKVDLF